MLNVLRDYNLTSLCAPPTVWRMLVQEPLAEYRVSLRELVSAGEPLNPEVIEAVQKAWGLTIRDGYGQTETTAQIGNPPGQRLKIGSMGRPLPGYPVVLLDADGRPSETDGEICLPLDDRRPLGLTEGYADDQEKTSEAMRAGWYHTGDLAVRDEDGYLTFVGRGDDVFKASDYRLSPFELESVLIEHPAVVEAAVVPSPDPVRHAVPKAFVVLAPGLLAIEGSRGGHPRVLPRNARAVQAHPADRIRGAAKDHFGEDPARRAAGGGARPAQRLVNAARTNSSKRTSSERVVLAGPASSL